MQGRSVFQELEDINKRHNAKNRLIIYNIMLLLLLYSSWFTENEQELTRVVWKRLFSNKTKKKNDSNLRSSDFFDHLRHSSIHVSSRVVKTSHVQAKYKLVSKQI